MIIASILIVAIPAFILLMLSGKETSKCEKEIHELSVTKDILNKKLLKSESSMERMRSELSDTEDRLISSLSYNSLLRSENRSLRHELDEYKSRPSQLITQQKKETVNHYKNRICPITKDEIPVGAEIVYLEDVDGYTTKEVFESFNN